MVVYDSRDASPPPCRALAIGNFDGVHLGHQRLLQRAHSLAGDGRLAVITFAPLPLELLRPQAAPGRIGSDAMRVVWLQQARMSPEQFIERFLLHGLHIEHVVVGADFHYGHRRQGNVCTLRAAGAKHGFRVTVQEDILTSTSPDAARISSSRVRQALRAGDMSAAAALLGRAYSISGTIVQGQQLGRELGFPTINIDVSDWDCLLQGIYAVRVKLCHNGQHSELLPGVASIGQRPVVADHLPERARSGHWLEVHLFDFNRDCYGMHAEVIFAEKLRDEQAFASVDAMLGQMRNDCDQARKVLQQ